VSYVRQQEDVNYEFLHSPLYQRNVSVPASPESKQFSSIIKTFLIWGRYGLDVVLIYSAFMVAYWLRYNLLSLSSEEADYIPVSFEEYLRVGGVYALILVSMLNVKGFYKLSRTTALFKELSLLITAVVTSAALTMLAMQVFLPEIRFSRLLIIYLIPLTLVVMGSEHLLMRGIHRAQWLRGVGVHNLLVVGATDTGVRLMRNFAGKTGTGYNLVGFVDDEIRYSDWTILPRYGNSIKRGNPVVPHLGQTRQLNELLSLHKITEVIIALPAEEYQTINDILDQCRAQGVAITLVPDLFKLQPNQMSVQSVNGVPVIVTDRPAQSGTSYLFKRLVDTIGALLLLMLAAIPMMVVAIAIKLDSKGPVIFRQTRVGKNGKVFTFLKFRSMYTDADVRLAELQAYNETEGATFKMKNDPRVTRVGRFIRRTSLDELPQFFNVLFGQMSLVGPRPGLPREVTNYRPWQYRRLEVTPGLTGLWQVNGRSSISFEDMVKLDIYYAEHWSFWLDLKILFQTVRAVLRTEGAY
jgi:exopolysaccharide biosynthesis polyprenyl glycosylphosphotransferase